MTRGKIEGSVGGSCFAAAADTITERRDARETNLDGSLPIIFRNIRFISRVDCVEIGVKVEDIADFRCMQRKKPNLNGNGNQTSTFEMIIRP